MHPWIYIFNLQIPSFLVVISLSMTLAVFVFQKILRRSQLNSHIGWNIALILMIGGLIGGRLLHVLFEMPDYYLAHPLDILALWQGGFVFYGGALVAVSLADFYVRRQDPNRRWLYYDLFTPIASITYGLGRIGCFLSGCCYGKESASPFSVMILNPEGVWQGRLPIPLFYLGFEFCNLLIIYSLRRGLQKQPGSIFYVWLFLNSVERFALEFLRDDFRGPSLVGLSISSWISGLLILFSVLNLRKISPFLKK